MKEIKLWIRDCFGYLLSYIDFIIFGLVVSFFIFDHYTNWQAMWTRDSNENPLAAVIVDSETANRLRESTKVDDHITKFLGDNSNGGNWLSDISNHSIDSLFKNYISYFNVESLEGYFDELYGFIWFSQVLLLIIAISLLILFIIYFFINIFMLNKDKLSKKLNISSKNKIFQFYFKYQVILGYISFYIFPFLIILGLIELIYILNYLITHPLPLESLDVDIHTYISSKPK